MKDYTMPSHMPDKFPFIDRKMWEKPKMDNAEKMASDIALAMNGGEWKDGKWYSKGHRDAWIKAVQPYADEIERLREENEKLRNGSRIVMEKTSWDAFQNASQEIERLREHCDRMASLAIDNAKDTERALKLFKINNRLRAAFNEILNHPVEESKQWEVAVHEMKRIARKELSEEDGE